MKQQFLPYIFSAVLGLGLVSCDLDLTPENAITYSNAFATESELNTTTITIHFYLNNAMDAVRPLTKVGLLADESQYDDQLRQGNPRTILESSADWQGLYRMIFESNLLLENIGSTKGLTQDRYNYHAGQAHFALGFGYLQLARAYGKAVIPLDAKEIRVYSLSSQQEVIDAGIRHAEQAYNMLPVFSQVRNTAGASVTSKQYAAKGSAAALLAHLYAWKGSMADLYGASGVDAKAAYEKSVEYATHLINGEAGAYSLVESPEALCQLLSNPTANNPEEIFSLVYDKSRGNESTTKNDVATSYATWPVNDTKLEGDLAQADYRLYRSTVDKLYPDATDLRRTAFFYKQDEEHLSGGTDYAVPYKFRNAVYTIDQSSEAGKYFLSIDANYVYWRLADLYLLRAECLNKLGRTAEAMADLNVIRARAGAAAYPANGESDLKRAIFHEREREFVLENDSRYYDILRNGYVKTDLTGKWPLLTSQDFADGALNLPIPYGAQRDKDGKVINGLILQRPYWHRYNN